jgi:hypothetical protein
VTPEIGPEYTQGLQRMPAGLAFRLYADTLFHPPFVPRFLYRPFGRSGRLEEMVPVLYADACAARAEYLLLRGGSLQEAREATREALVFQPASARARRLAGLLP